MRHGSLFSGIGGFDLAAEWMGWENVFHCEWNKFGQQVLKYYWPEAISYDDICKTDFSIWRGKIDILTGGFPCQPYSMAGKRKGTEDARHLWPEMLRAIRECRPTWIVGENVPGLINWSGGLVFEQVCAELEGEWYEVQPIVLPASGVNAPHRRDRVWIVAYAKSYYDRGTEREFYKEDGGQIRELLPTLISASSWTGSERPSQNPNFNGRGGDERKEESSIGRFGNIGTGDNERVRADNDEIGDAANPQAIRMERGMADWKQIARTHGEQEIPVRSSTRTDWTYWPTVAPLRSGNDGLSSRLDGITFSKWRNESIKAGGNAIVPQVAYQIFKVIEKMHI